MTNAGTNISEQSSPGLHTTTAAVNVPGIPQLNVSNTCPGVASEPTLTQNSPCPVAGTGETGRTAASMLQILTSASEITLEFRRRSQFSAKNQRALQLSRFPMHQNRPKFNSELIYVQSPTNEAGSPVDAPPVLADFIVYVPMAQGNRRGAGLQSKRPNNLSMKNVFRFFPAPTSDGGRCLGFFL